MGICGAIKKRKDKNEPWESYPARVCVCAYRNMLGLVLDKVLTFLGNAALDFLQHRIEGKRKKKTTKQISITKVLVEATGSAQHETKETV